MIDFRPATTEDLDAMGRIEQACFADPWTDDMLSSELQMPDSHYVMMEEQGAVVGYYAYMHVLDEVHILNVAILPDYQGRGLGRLMMEHLLAHIPADTVGVTLEVRVSNTRARRLYESVGFHCVGVRKGYYMDKEDAAIYWRTEGA